MTIAPDDVTDRLDELAARANGGTTVPPFDSFEARPSESPHRRPSALLAEAAVLVVGVIAASIVIAVDRDPKVTTTAQDPADTGAHLMPDAWPTGIDGDISASSTDANPFYGSLPSFLLVRDGRALVTARLIGFPVMRMFSALSQAQSYVIDGRLRALTTEHGLTTWVTVEVEPGRTLLLSSSTVGGAELNALAAAFDPNAERFTALPTGWSVERDDLRLATTFGADIQGETGRGVGYPTAGPGWSSIARRTKDGSRAVTVYSRHTPDAASAVQRIAELDPRAASPVDIGAGGVLRPVDDFVPVEGQATMLTLTWAPTTGILAFAVGQNVSGDELVATARASRELTVAEWAEIADPPALRSADGFREPEGRPSSVVATGDADGFRWRITRDPGPNDTTITMLDVLFDEGDETGFGWSPPPFDPRGPAPDDGYLMDLMSSRTERHVVVMTVGPLGARNTMININGIEASATAVDVPEIGGAMVFATLPGRSTPDIQVSPTDLDVVLTGTLADGTAFQDQISP